MNFFPTSLPGVMKIEPVVHGDNRGYLFESYSKKTYERFVKDLNLTNSYELNLKTDSEIKIELENSSILLRCICGKIEMNISSKPSTISSVIAIKETIDSQNHFQYLIPQGYTVSLLSNSESIVEIQSDKDLTWR